jgi:hypothetical protein
VRLAKHEHVVQAFPADTPQKSFDTGVLLRRALRRAQEIDVTCRGHVGEGRPVLAVVVMDEVPRMVAKGRRLTYLLGDPGIGGVARRAHMHHPACGEFDQEEGGERPEEQVGDGQEISGPDVLAVVAQEGAPGLA